MNIVSIVIQIILALGFLMFGMMKFSSKQMVEEFTRYGLPGWFRVVTGLVEWIGAALMVAGIWNDAVAAFGGLWLAITMVGAVITHIRVKDPLSKAGMPIILIILSLVVLILNV